MDVGCFYWLGSLFYISFFGALSLLPFYLLEQFLLSPTIFDINFLIWVLFAAISPGIIAFSLYTYTQKYLGASTTGLTLYLFTVYGAFYGIILFDEILKIYHFVGTLMVFFGIFLVRKNRYEKK